MLDFIARHALAELWALVWHFGIVFGVAILALLWAWFSPIFKKTALWVALGAAIIGFTAGVYTKLGADYARAQWKAAEQHQLEKGRDARAAAERDIAHGLRDDRYDRDNH